MQIGFSNLKPFTYKMVGHNISTEYPKSYDLHNLGYFKLVAHKSKIQIYCTASIDPSSYILCPLYPPIDLTIPLDSRDRKNEFATEIFTPINLASA